MGLGERLMQTIREVQRKRLLRASGPIGDFYRSGGSNLLYDIPATTDGRVIDAGGFEGNWTAGVMTKYGCRSDIYEPVPDFSEQCRERFRYNTRVVVHDRALGGGERNETFEYSGDGTSSTSTKDAGGRKFEAKVVDAAGVVREMDERISCLKLNIEGGEYEVLERLAECGLNDRIDCFLIQFHRKASDWSGRLERVRAELEGTHALEWSFPMVWEKWTIRRQARSPSG